VPGSEYERLKELVVVAVDEVEEERRNRKRA